MANVLLVIIIIIVALYLYVSQKIIKIIVGLLFNKIYETFLEIKQKFNTLKYSDFRKEAEDFAMIKEKKLKLGFITQSIGYFEMILFAGLTYLLIGNNLSDIMFKLLAVSAGWIGLKIFGSYQSWSGPVLGRAYYYTFLIGSLLSIIFAVALGLLFHLVVTQIYN